MPNVDIDTKLGEWLDHYTQSLHEQNALRCWSVVITIFGDSVFTRGGIVAASTLTAIIKRLGISPGTLRVSLSRLAKEGWIERYKEGRKSFYKLTQQGASEFGPASQLIYASSLAPDDGQYSFYWLPPSGSGCREAATAILIGNKAIELASGLYLAPALPKTIRQSETLQACFVVKGTIENLPGNIWAKIVPEELAKSYQALIKWLEKLEQMEADIAPTGLDSIAARTLIIHQWRRLILQQENLPASLLPNDWPGEHCRSQVITSYHKLWPASQAWLNLEFANPKNPLGATQDQTTSRFK